MDDDLPARRFHLVANGNWTEEARTELIEAITPRQPRQAGKSKVISIFSYKDKKERDR